MNFELEPKEIIYTVDRLSFDIVGIENDEVIINYCLYAGDVVLEDRIKRFPIEMLQLIAKKSEDVNLYQFNQLVLSQWELQAKSIIT